METADQLQENFLVEQFEDALWLQQLTASWNVETTHKNNLYSQTGGYSPAGSVIIPVLAL